jgi:predicted AAA+ superfamily ATPase
VQRRPDLFPVLRVLAGRGSSCSAAPLRKLLGQSSETLAGRIAYHTLPGFDLSEVGAKALDRLWIRGGFPLSFTARSEALSERWRAQFVRTFIGRELAALELGIAANAVDRFWRMLAHYHGQVWNVAELARGLGVSEKTVRHYLKVLVDTFVAQAPSTMARERGQG